MPWARTGPMKERLRFVVEVERRLFTMTELCARYGISRRVGHKWVRRYEKEGLDGLKERSRAPHRCPHKISQEVADAIIKARRQHPRWGPRKLLAWLARRKPELALPAASTAGDLLVREGLVKPRRRQKRPRHPGREQREVERPNEQWAADFKGQFRTGDGQYCYPLTISDQHSRYLLACKGLLSTEGGPARRVFERVFREHGLPDALLTDNGVPFVSPRALQGLSPLKVWLIRLGVKHDRIQKGHPEQNGRHERMHRTLKAETARPPAKHRKAQQGRFDRFRQEYNEERPHEALDQRPPAQVWLPSTRPYPRRLRQPEYPGHFELRKVSSVGNIRFQSKILFLSDVLKGEHVGLEEVDDGVWSVYFYDFELRRFEERELRDDG